MASNLTNEILLQICDNLGLVTPLQNSIKDNRFYLNKTISLLEEDEEKKLELWGATVPVQDGKFEMVLTEVSYHPGEKEYFIVSKLDDCPMYGCYVLLESTVVDKNVPRHAEILFSLKDNAWLPTNTFLQATFLAGMEQLKDLLVTWQPLKSSELIESLKTFTDHVISEE